MLGGLTEMMNPFLRFTLWAALRRPRGMAIMPATWGFTVITLLLFAAVARTTMALPAVAATLGMDVAVVAFLAVATMSFSVVTVAVAVTGFPVVAVAVAATLGMTVAVAALLAVTAMVSTLAVALGVTVATFLAMATLSFSVVTVAVAALLAVTAMGLSMIAIAMVSTLAMALGVAVAPGVTLLATTAMCGSLDDEAFGHSGVLASFVLISGRFEFFGRFEESPRLFAKLIRVLCDGRVEHRRSKCHDHGQSKAVQRNCGNRAVHLDLSPGLKRSSNENRSSVPRFHHVVLSCITYSAFFVRWCVWSLHAPSSHGSTLPNR